MPNDAALDAKEVCEGCRFFMKQEPQHIYGDCHRQPPQFGFYANVYEKAEYGTTRHRIDITRERGGVWPNVAQDEWCGEFQARSSPLPVLNPRQLGPQDVAKGRDDA